MIRNKEDENYCEIKRNEINYFHELINSCDFVPIKTVLTDEWFDKAKKEGELSWLDSNVPYSGLYFPIRWLSEEGQFKYICNCLKGIYDYTPKKSVFRRKINGIATQDWDTNECNAFELTVLSKFFVDGVLSDIEPLYGLLSKCKADALIRIEKRDIIVEITAFSYCKKYEARIGSVDLLENVKKISRKVHDKYINQIYYTDKPCLLIIMKPEGCFMDQLQINWSLEELNLPKQISGLVIINSHLVRSGSILVNPNCIFPLNKKEIEYLGSFFYKNKNF